MKSEKEFCLIVKLLDSPYIRGGLFRKEKTACKKDFERYLQISENNKEFHVWLNKLIKFKAVECVGREIRGIAKEIDVFVINFKVLENLLKNNPFFDPSRRYFERDTISFK